MEIHEFCRLERSTRPHLFQVGVAQCLKITQNVSFEFFNLAFSTNLCLVTLFNRKIHVFKNSPKLAILGIFNQLLSSQNVNLAY